MPHGILAVAQQAGVASSGSSPARFLEFVVGSICEPKHEMAEVLAEFILLGEQLEAGALRSLPRVKDHVAIAHKYCARYLPLHWSYKTNRARAQVKCGGVTWRVKLLTLTASLPRLRLRSC